MNIRKTIAATATAALLMTGALLAQAPHGHMGHMMGKSGAAGMADHLASALSLTDAQKASAKQLHQELWTKAQPLMAKMKQQRDELKAMHEDFANRFSALLNADQKAKFQEMRQQFEHGDGPGHPAEEF
jgi:Spy/CpxP family protein refolding chaperone